MSYTYKQDCGGFKIDYSPKPSFFSFRKSGSTSYSDLGTLTAGTIDDIGRYTITMITYQDINDPADGFSIPFRGIIPSAEQPFLLTINPCSVSSLQSSSAISDITYRIGAIDNILIHSGTFSFSDLPNACGYT